MLKRFSPLVLCEAFGQIYAQRAAHPQLPVVAWSRQLVHSALEEVIEVPLLQLLELLPGPLCSSKWTTFPALAPRVDPGLN